MKGQPYQTVFFMNGCNNAVNMEFESDSESELEVETINELVSDLGGEA